LVSKGFVIVGQNIAWKRYEVDIIAQDTKTGQVVFVEVKRRKSSFVAPHLAISRNKRQALSRFAQEFVRAHYYHYKNKLSYRIDAISITLNKLEHFKNITWWN
jgi:Holliday junction resolvase-like predicted endonuclease